MDHVILNHGQVTWMTPELAPLLLTTTPHHGRTFELSADLACIAALHGGSLAVLGSNSKLEDDLNCLVLQVTRCPTPNRSGDLINRVWKYMQDNCDGFGGWWSYDCFHLEDMKKCEKIFALRDSKTSTASCREFDRFRHCIGDVVQKQCHQEDVLSMGNYLLDSAGDMVWSCPHQSGPLKSPIVDEGYVGVDVLPPLSPPLSGAASQEPSNRIAVEESHLRGVYSAALTGEGPFVTEECNRLSYDSFSKDLTNRSEPQGMTRTESNFRRRSAIHPRSGSRSSY
ncbi:uncharacterized protein TNCV_832731, partial [Trichonephila clavipes]